MLKQLDEFACLIDGQNRESSMDGLRAKQLRKIVVQNEKLTSKSKIDLARLPPCHSALKSHLQGWNHRVALYKRADESMLEKLKPYDDGLRMEYWNLCGIVVLRYQTLWLIFWTLVIVKRKKSRRRKTRMDAFDFDDFSENDGER